MLSDAELDQLRKDNDDRLARMRAITEELTGAEFEGSTRSGNAGALVDGQGTLIDLRIADKALTVRGLDLDALNADILEAISDARQRAAQRACHLLHPVFPALFPEELYAEHVPDRSSSAGGDYGRGR